MGAVSLGEKISRGGTKSTVLFAQKKRSGGEGGRPAPPPFFPAWTKSHNSISLVLFALHNQSGLFHSSPGSSFSGWLSSLPSFHFGSSSVVPWHRLNQSVFHFSWILVSRVLTSSSMASNDFERVLCVKQEVFVFRIPPRPSNRGYR